MGSMFGGDTPTPQLNTTNPYQPYTGQAASTAAGGGFGGIGGLQQYATGASAVPQFGQLAQSTVNAGLGPQGQYAQGVAGQVAPGMVGGGMQSMGAGQQLTGAGQGMLPYAGQILNTAFDPQQQLYQQYIQQVQDQTGAQMANTGVGSSPYGASVMGNTLGQANLGWQNAQLGRQLQGIQGASGALGAAGGAETTGAQLGQQGGQQAMAGGMLPYATLSGLNQGGMGALQGYIGAGQQGAQVPQTAIGDWMSYLTGGTGAQNVSNQAQMAMAKFTADQQQQQYQNIASAIGGVAGLAGGFMGGGFGGMGGGGGGMFGGGSSGVFG
jgi:hypothetical protein